VNVHGYILGVVCLLSGAPITFFCGKFVLLPFDKKTNQCCSFCWSGFQKRTL